MEVIDGFHTGAIVEELQKILSGVGGASVTRVFGEHRTIERWLAYNKDVEKLISLHPEIVKICETNAGFYATQNYSQELNYFLEVYLESLRKSDMVYTCCPLNEKGQTIGEIFLRGFQERYYIWSAYFIHEWFPLLEGKKVLVCSPFKKSILAQWDRRDLLFSKDLVHGTHGKITYPNFALDVVETHNTIEGNTPYPHRNWRESLNDMSASIAEREFDIALLGCGSYGSPLCETIRKLGKKALYLGSWCQYIFGIKAKRWENAGNPANIWFNEHWVKPLEEERPKTYMQVENGCYW